MPTSSTAKLFKNGASQAVRLPAEFRFPGTEVRIRRDHKTGDVVLSPALPSAQWDAFFDTMRAIDMPQGFLEDRPLNQPPRERGLFGRK